MKDEHFDTFGCLLTSSLIKLILSLTTKRLLLAQPTQLSIIHSLTQLMNLLWQQAEVQGGVSN